MNSASNQVNVSLAAKSPNGETAYSLVRVELQNLPCRYRESLPFYYYTCEVSGDQLRSNPSQFVRSFTVESWSYSFSTEKWELLWTASPEYSSLGAGAAGLAVEFRGVR